MGVGVIELFDECRLDTVGTGLAHQVVPPVVVGCRDKGHGGVLRKASPSRSVVIPVAQSLTEDITGVLCRQIVYIAFHLWTVLSDHAVITIERLVEEG